MIRDFLIRTLLSLIFVVSFSAVAQTSQQADMLQAKAYLESLIVQRFTQELATQVQAEQFSISAFLTLRKVEKKEPDLDPIADMDIGFLNPEQLYKEYASEKNGLGNYFENFVVNKVTVSVGLKAALGEEHQKEIEKWLQERVAAEFGKIGVGVIHTIKGPVAVDEKPAPTFLDQLKELQGLAGQLILAIAILFGVMLWKVMSGKDAANGSGGPEVNINNKMGEDGVGGRGGPEDSNQSQTISQELSLQEKVDKVAGQIQEVVPKLLPELETIIGEWCKAGDQGYIQTALLAQTVGKVIGRLPIPAKYHKEVVIYFTKMNSLGLAQRLEYLNLVYWDLMAALNLGSNALYKPFSYLNEAPVETVNQVLMENNSKLRTVASLYMSDTARMSYMMTLDKDAKSEIFKEAAQLNTLKESEFDEMDRSLSGYFGDESDELTVSLQSAFPKLVDALPLRETVLLLKDLEGDSVYRYKITKPSLAFFHQWKESYLENYLGRVSSEEILAYLSLRSDLKDIILPLLPPRMRTIVSDDLNRGSQIKPEELELNLSSMVSKLQEMIDRGDLDLMSAFKEPSAMENTSEVRDVA